MWNQPQDRERRDTLPAARLAHDTQCLALADREAHAVHGLDHAGLSEELSLEVLDAEKEAIRTCLTIAHGSPSIWGSRDRNGAESTTATEAVQAKNSILALFSPTACSLPFWARGRAAS